MKIAIIGTGRVGSTLAYCLMLKQLCDHLVIAGRTGEKAQGDALDLRHSLAFCARPMRIEACANGDVGGCDIVVVTASVPVEGKIASRLQLGEGNAALFRQLIPLLAANNPDALLLILTNPVDVMTYAASRLSGFPPRRVMGVGTLVDSARFRTLLSRQEHIHPDDLRAYILGEHGPHQFPVLGNAQAGGELIGDTPAHRQLFSEVIDAAFHVYRLKGYTNHAIATATAMVIEAIAYDECRTMPLAVRFDEWMGIADNCFSIPVVVGRGGVVRPLHPELNERERQDLQAAAAAVKSAMDSLIPDLVGNAP
jgi:L-lactate dehydrogenase